MTDLLVNVHHVTRVEGHGNIVVQVKGGELEACRFDVVETPRFFEAMLRGRSYQDCSPITSRICGICAVGHATTSIRASEDALGIEPTEQTRLLRELNFMGEILDSHVLHAYMLVAPDALSLPSVLPLAKSAPEVVKRALRLKRLAGELCRVIAGRHTHPLGLAVGGFTIFPSEADLLGLKNQLLAARPDLEATVELFGQLTFPEFERDTEYVALRADGRYPFIDGDIQTSEGARVPLGEYRSITNERVVRHSSAKHTHHQRDSYMVGALARFKLNHSHLHPTAKAAATALNLTPTTTNPYLNTVAQVVEIVHAVEHALELIEELGARGVTPEPLVPPSRLSGRGVGACEVPRGILFHAYEFEEGRVAHADCVIPTGQNLANLELDMRALVPTLLGESVDLLRLRLEMLVRAYDPCISCSTHTVTLEFLD